MTVPRTTRSATQTAFHVEAYELIFTDAAR